MKRIAATFVTFVALSACGAPIADGAGGGLARASQHEVTLGNEQFVASVMPGNAGLIISKAGATAMTGLTVRVNRDGALLGQADGKLAKVAAVKGCAQASGRFDERVVGRVASPGVWAFEGACT